MTTYAKITDFASKDALLTGNPAKIVKGVEIDDEFNAIATADATSVKGPIGATADNTVARWDGTTGRAVQGSGVTISDADVVTASGFTGPHNGTVGATTPSTGAFTTLSASGGITSSSNGFSTQGTGSGYFLTRRDTNTYAGGVYSTAGEIRLDNASGTVWTADTAGNLALGITPSAWGVSFKSIELASAGLMSNTSGSSMFLMNNAYYNGTNWIYKYTAAASHYDQTAGTHQWFTAPSGTAGNAITFTQVATINANGYLKASNNGAYLGATSNYYEFNSNVFSDTYFLRNTASWNNTGAYLARLQVPTASSQGTTDRLISGEVGGVSVFLVGTNGNVQNTNNSYGAISDVKLKENITDATPKLAGLMQVRVVNYNLKTDPAHKQLGVIAQELEQVFPGMVEESPDTIEVTKTREVPAVLDDEGNEVTPATTEEYTEREATGTTTKAVKYSVFVPMLIKAMQEQQALIVDLQARLAALEAA